METDARIPLDHASETLSDHGEQALDDGRLPGAELPKAVYRSLTLAFGSIVLASWLAFGGVDDADLALAVATTLGIVFFALPVIMFKAAAVRSPAPRTPLRAFLSSRVEIATGTLTGFEACVQILTIPLTLAFAALAIGAVYVFVA